MLNLVETSMMYFSAVKLQNIELFCKVAILSTTLSYEAIYLSFYSVIGETSPNC